MAPNKKVMDAMLGDSSDCEDELDADDNNAAKGAPISAKRTTPSYEELCQRSYAGADISLVGIPGPKGPEASSDARKNESDDDANDDEPGGAVFKNAFGKWEKSARKRKEPPASPPSASAEPRAPSLSERRGEALRAQAAHALHSGAVETFAVHRATGAAATEREAEAKARLALREESVRRTASETVRQKNKRKESRGQATFTFKEGRDCPDVWRAR